MQNMLSPGGGPDLSPQMGTTAGHDPGQLFTALSDGAVFQSLGEMFVRMSSCCVPELKLFPMSLLEVKMTSQDAGADSFEDKINDQGSYEVHKTVAMLRLSLTLRRPSMSRSSVTAGFQIRFHTAQAGSQLPVSPRMTWNSCSSCLYPPSPGIRGMSHQAWYAVSGIKPTPASR